MIEIDSLDDTCSNVSGQSSQLFPDTGSQEASILRSLNEKTPLFTPIGFFRVSNHLLWHILPKTTSVSNIHKEAKKISGRLF